MNFDTYLPTETFTLVTALTVQEACKRILNNIEPKQVIFTFFNGDPNPYYGRLIANTFTITRNIYRQRIFLPEISGQLTSAQGHTLVNVRVQARAEAVLFLMLVLLASGLLCAFILYDAFDGLEAVLKGAQVQIMVLVPFVVFFCIVILPLVVFKRERKKAEDFLSTILEAHEGNNLNDISAS